MAPDCSPISGDAVRARGAGVAEPHGDERRVDRDVAIRLCGGLSVTVDDRPVSRALTPQVGIALACVALNRPRPVTRERLMTALWGRDVAPAYGKLLDSVLHKLRRATGPGVIERAEVRGWCLCRSVRVDFEEAERRLEEAAADAQHADWPAVVAGAERVVALASGGLLPAHDADWLEDWRRRLEEWGLQAQQLLAEGGLHLGGAHLPAAERAARAIVDADPYRENGHALLMRAVAAQGNTVEAQRIYNRLQARLKRSGHFPGPALRAEFERLVQGLSVPAPARDDSHEPPPGAHEPEARPFFATRRSGAFVGRRREVDLLQDIFRRAMTERRRELVLLEGEPGIGKTRLALQLMSVCESDGALALYGRCDADAEAFYQPFVEALCDYVPRAPAPRRRWWLDRYGDDIGVVPRLGKAFGVTARPRGTAEESERYRLFEAVSEILSDIARSQPVVLVLDDMHWARKPTRLMLREIVRSTARAPLLIVVAYRDTERASDLIDTRAHLRRELVYERIGLGGLGRDETVALIDELSSRPAPDDVSGRIWQDTEGNPFFVEELLRDFEARAREGPGQAGDWWRERALPQPLDEVIGHRLAALSDETNEVLRKAAVIGREFSLELLGEIGGHGEEELDRAIEEALEAHVVAEVPQEYGRCSFTHSLIRQTLYDRMTATRRARLHGVIGEAIERMPGPLDDRGLGELAHHFALAPPGPAAAKAVDYAERAAVRAVESLAYEEAARQYATALDAHRRTRAPDTERTFALLLGRGGAHAKAGEVAAARSAFADAAEVARESGSARAVARAALGYSTAGQMAAGGIVDASVVTLLEDALARLGQDDQSLRSRLLARLAMELSFSEQRERRTALSDEALDIARSLGDPQTCGYALFARHWSLWGPANVDERLEATDELLRLAAATGDERLAMQGHSWRLADLLELGRIDGVDAEMTAYALLVEKRRRPSEKPYAELFRAMRLLLAGDLDQVEAVSTRACQLGERVRDTNAVQAHVLQIVTLRRERGGLDETIEQLVRDQSERFPAIPGWQCLLAFVCAEIGRVADARAILDRFARDDFRELPLDGLWLGAIATLAETASVLQDPAHAERLYALLEPYAELNVSFGWVAACGGSAARYRGLLARLLGRRDPAVEHLEAALEMNAAMRAQAWVARTRFDLARALLDAPEPAAADLARAERELDTALAEGGAMGMSRLVEDAAGLRRAVDLVHGRPDRV